MVLSSLVRRHDRSFVVHLLEPVINRCLYGDLCNLGASTDGEDFDLLQTFPIPLIPIVLIWNTYTKSLVLI